MDMTANGFLIALPITIWVSVVILRPAIPGKAVTLFRRASLHNPLLSHLDHYKHQCAVPEVNIQSGRGL